MKQLFGFCAFAFIVITIITIAAIFLTFRAVQDEDFLKYLAEESVGEGEEVQSGPPAPQIGWTGDAAESSAVHVVLEWREVEVEDNRWNFAATDPIIRGSSFDTVVTLFGTEWTSPTSPWSSELQTEFGPEARDYVEQVVDRYADHVRFWQIGNQMDLWVPREADEQVEFSIEQQVVFLMEVAEVIRQYDDDAVVLLPALSELSTYSIDEWLVPLTSVAGSNWFDVVTYRYSGDWQSFSGQHDVLVATLDIQRLDGKPLWLVDSPASLQIVAQAFGNADAFVGWKSSNDQLEAFAQTAIPFSSVEEVTSAVNGANVYRFQTEEGNVFILWGAGEYQVPGFDPVQLSEEPILLK